MGRHIDSALHKEIKMLRRIVLTQDEYLKEKRRWPRHRSLQYQQTIREKLYFLSQDLVTMYDEITR